jgi:NAD(P)-dependent dehydrogenase (short-subunit alcohol dehydrogenase family)
VADLSDHKSLTAAATKVAALTNGSLDYLIVNGVHQNPAADFLTPTEFIGHEDLLHDYMVKALEVNVIGVMYAINAFLPLVHKSNIKKIIVITTGVADTETQRQGKIGFFVTYSSLKAALNMVVARYSIELKGDGVIFLALSPGLVNTQEAPRKSSRCRVQAARRMETIVANKFCAAPAEVMPRIGILMQEVLATNPEFNGLATPAESVTLQRKVIENITIKDSGAFLSHFGNKQWV